LLLWFCSADLDRFFWAGPGYAAGRTSSRVPGPFHGQVPVAAVLPECRLAGFSKILSGEVAFPDTALTSEGVQVVFGSHVDFPVDDRWCGQNLTFKLISGQNLQIFPAIQHNYHALRGRHVDLIVRGDG
jgi:hypothetical protein